MPKKTEPQNPRGPRPLKAGSKVRVSWTWMLTEEQVEAFKEKEPKFADTGEGLTLFCAAHAHDALLGVVKDHQADAGRRRAEELRAEIEAERAALAEKEKELASLQGVGTVPPGTVVGSEAEATTRALEELGKVVGEAEEEGAPV